MNFAASQATAMLPASDIARAKRWYADTLGLTPAEEFGEMGAVYDLGGTRVFLYPTQFAGTAGHTLLSFDSADLAADMLHDGVAVLAPLAPDDLKIPSYVAAQADARKAYRGLWSSTFEMPWDWRARRERQSALDNEVRR